MHVVALDTETCALGRGRDSIVQFCAVELDETLRETARWTQLIDPGIRIPPFATRIHGISDADVRGAPRFAEIARPLRRLITPGSVFVAYNAAFDLGVLNLEFARCGVPGIPRDQPVLDPLLLERRLTPRNLGAVYRRYTGRELEGAHDAEADTLGMIEILRHQRVVHRDRMPEGLAETVEWLGTPLRRGRTTLDVFDAVPMPTSTHDVVPVTIRAAVPR